jgi:NADH:ubiquinone oxidoreductase subunit 5 (subunit L)/multisubunit Na+/H+ antiporter MnhA subunit
MKLFNNYNKNQNGQDLSHLEGVHFLTSLKMKYNGVYAFLNRKWFFDKIQNELIAQVALHWGGNKTYKVLDKGLIELMGPYGLANLMRSFGQGFSSLSTGSIYNYILLGLTGSIVILAIIGVMTLTV